MLDAIRKRTGSIVVKVLLVLLVLSFGAWGIGDYITGNVSGVAAATVGDREVSAQAASEELQRELNRLRQFLGDAATFETAQAFGLDIEVIRRLVRAQLFSLAASSHGVVISDESVRELIQSMPAFRGVTGGFDRATFRQAIANGGYSENRFIELIRDEMKQSFVVDSLDGGAIAPDTMVEQLFAYRNETRAAQFTTILDADFDNTAIPDDLAVNAYYQENQDQFMAPEYRDVSFIHLRAEDLVDGIDVSDDDIEDAYSVREDEFVTVARRNVDQAIFDSEEQASTALGMLSDGQTFADVAKSLTGTSAETLSLGWITPDQLLGADAADAVFSAHAGELAGPVQSMLGWHLFNIIDGEDETRKSLADVTEMLRHDVALERALDDLFGLANQLEDLLASGNTLEEAGATLNLRVPRVVAVSESGHDTFGNTLDGLPSQGFLPTVFATEEGTESPLVESGSDSYFIVRVNGITDPAVRPLDTIRHDVIAAIIADEQAQQSKDAADKIVSKLNASSSLAGMAGDFAGNLANADAFKRDGSDLPEGIPPAMAVSLFEKKVGEGAAVRSGGGYVVGHLINITAASLNRDSEAFIDMKNQLERGIRDDLVNQLSAALEIRYPVTINTDALRQSPGTY